MIGGPAARMRLTVVVAKSLVFLCLLAAATAKPGLPRTKLPRPTPSELAPLPVDVAHVPLPVRSSVEVEPVEPATDDGANTPAVELQPADTFPSIPTEREVTVPAEPEVTAAATCGNYTETKFATLRKQ